MQLKHIKLAGFKSFVDPTTVSFPGRRCAVVGPNGCGKSNIIDAVRWVMGESSARQLRGEALTDVIFNGSTSRKPTAMASIELAFDNKDGRIGGEYAAYNEITIRREVTRDSQSAYYLNGSKCRRRDIMDMFLGTGFGPRSYSIIEQGMISQLVEAKPDDLRVYLEEAAGISKYKERRRETETRIRHTKENLARLNDIREELERQLNHLQRQAKAAERYQKYKDEERKATAELHVLRLSSIKAELENREQHIRELEVSLEKAIAEQRRLDTEIEAKRAQHTERSEAFNKVQGVFYQLGGDIARIEEAIQYGTQRVKQLELDLEAVSQRRQETATQLAMDEQQITGLDSRLSEIAPRLSAARAADHDAAERAEASEAVVREAQEAWEGFNERFAANRREADVQASRIEHLEQVAVRLRGRLIALEDEYEGVGVAGDAPEMDALAEEIDAAADAVAKAEAELSRVLEEQVVAREDLLERERVLEEARSEVQGLRHELASLDAVQQAALGRVDDVADDWLTAQGLAAMSRVGEGLAVVAGWERAVETVLGDRLQAISVDSVADYAQALGDLEQGVVTLIEARRESEGGGELPTLAAFVRADVPLGALLNGVYAAQSLQVALAHRHTLALGESIITREGIWLGADWLRLARGDGMETGIIERGHRLEVLQDRVEQAELNLAELQGRMAEGKNRIHELDEERHELQDRSKRLSQRLGEMRTDHGVHKVRREEADARRERVNRERTDIEQQLAAEGERLVESRDRLREAESVREALEAERSQLTETRERSMAALEQARREARAERDAFHALNSEKQNLDSQLAATRTARDRLLRQREELETRRGELTGGIEQSQQPLPEYRDELKAKLDERLIVERQLGDVRASLETLDTDVRELESRRGEREAAVGAVRDSLQDERVARQGLAVGESNVLEQLRTTGRTLEETRDGMAEDATIEAWEAQLERLDRRIQRLGPINLAAIEEYESAHERHVGWCHQTHRPGNAAALQGNV
jgi:chromosome segregation protein